MKQLSESAQSVIMCQTIQKQSYAKHRVSCQPVSKHVSTLISIVFVEALLRLKVHRNMGQASRARQMGEINFNKAWALFFYQE